ncbi:MAG: hypothetical protein NZ847_13395, partial [Acidobacteria bacterium]|nr:hypothetical protein [Acidobacteriota bacterium]
AIARAEVGANITRFSPALQLAKSILEQSEFTEREVVLISDFQKNGWTGDEAVSFEEGIRLRPIPIDGTDASNVTITSVAFEREPFSAAEQVTAMARLVNQSDLNVTNLLVTLELDGHEVATQLIDIEASGPATVSFDPFIVGEDQLRGTVRISDDALLQDNMFHFTVSSGQLVSVLIVKPDASTLDSSLYLENALAVGNTPTFVTETITVRDLNTDALEGRSVVILNDTAPFDGPTGNALVNFIGAGGGLLAVLGESVRWTPEASDVLPGSFGTPTARLSSRSNVLGYVDYSHPVFDIFNAPRSGDLSSAQFFQQRPLTVTNPESVLARFADGSVALAERRIGQGHVLVWASTLDSYWNDLALKPVYLPFVHQLAKHLGKYVEPTEWHTTAQLLDVASMYAARGHRLEFGRDDPVAVAPTGARLPITGTDSSVFLELTHQGFYEIHTPGAVVDVPVALAVNADRSESDLATLDPQELASSVTGRAVTERLGNLVLHEQSPEDAEEQQALWRYLLVAALLLLTAETVLSNQLSQRVR